MDVPFAFYNTSAGKFPLKGDREGCKATRGEYVRIHQLKIFNFFFIKAIGQTFFIQYRNSQIEQNGSTFVLYIKHVSGKVPIEGGGTGRGAKPREENTSEFISSESCK